MYSVHVLMYISTAYYIRVAMVTQRTTVQKIVGHCFYVQITIFTMSLTCVHVYYKDDSHVILWQVCRRVDVTGTNRMVIHGVSH